MAGTPMSSASFGDLLEPDFQEVFTDQYEELPDKIPMIFTTPPGNGRYQMKWSEVGALEDFSQFSGTLDYDAMNQGYDTTATHIEFAKGIQIERSLYDDDQYDVMRERPSALAAAAFRTRQKHAFRIFNNGFSVDTFFYVNSEGVAQFSNSHTSTAPGADTSVGFDNLGTAAISAVAVQAAHINMRDFRDDRGNRASFMPDELFVPTNLRAEAFEITQSEGVPDSAENNRNINKGAYKVYECEYLTDTNNWFLCDSTMRKRSLLWIDRIPIEFAFVEDFDSLVAKYRAYMRYANARRDWRWAFGSNVS